MIIFAFALLLLTSQIQCMQDQASPEWVGLSQIMHDYISNQLKEMFDNDQAIRKSIIKEDSIQTQIKLKEELNCLKEKQAQALNAIIKLCGWPCIAKFDAETAQAAWMIAQHADHDVKFQASCLQLMMSELAKKHVLPAQVAYLFDRVCINQNLPQFYGTQLDDQGLSLPIYGCDPLNDDAEKINQRRDSMGLDDIQTYIIETYKLNHSTLAMH